MPDAVPAPQRVRHRKEWEDDRMVGVSCNGKFAGVLAAGEPFECEVCGMALTLHWDVRIIEPAATRSRDGGKGVNDGE